MKNLVNLLLFQVAWFLCVGAAAQGDIWFGPAVVALVVALHLGFLVAPGARLGEARYILVVTLLGLVLDSALGWLGVTRYPSSEASWGLALVPPWIAALWGLFATLPHHSMAWLHGRTAWALALGAIGGPLSYLGGERMGAVARSETPGLTVAVLALEYACLTPLLLGWARRRISAGRGLA